MVHPDRVLVKTSTDNNHWQTESCSDNLKFLEPTHSQGDLVHTQVQMHIHLQVYGKESLHMASAFLGKFSITVVDLIQQRNWIPRIFYESNLMEARFEIA